jgi:hypothetical protein
MRSMSLEEILRDPEIGDAVRESIDDHWRKAERDKLGKQLKKMRKAVDGLTEEVAGMRVAEPKELLPALTPEQTAVFAKAAVANIEQMIGVCALLTRRAGDSDVTAYNRALSENPQLYSALEIAKRSALPDPFRCV